MQICEASFHFSSEVHNIFSRLIPQQGLARFESNRQRQSIIPDLRIKLPVGRITKSVLGEVKVISNSLTRYRPTWQERGVDRRADQLHNEYVLKARRVDTTYCGTEQGQVGPVQNKLLSYERVRGLVFGAFGEASQPVHQLVDSIATSRVSVAVPQRGRMGVERSVAGERAIVVGQVRRKLSIASVRAQCISLHGRLELIGTGLAETAARKSAAMAMAHAMELDRATFLQTLRAPQHGVRRGFGKVE